MKTKLVPVEPTEEMLEAARLVLARDYSGGGRDDPMAPIYRAMLAAAPEASAADVGALEAAKDIAKDIAQQWDDGEGSRTFNACMEIHDRIAALARTTAAQTGDKP